ncbi:3-oxoacyl-[acyl-carrier protein] reductase [Syntrophus gentianae]|uniref:3-oxoacyl-[acyl-carrier protein] reductase n=1 Tax=Syntrophus gentianae TaxID=43775 RepID=A0A1H7Z7L6_9BACT|nr:SDR family NAD(P)-dependent oxidoreductase [Syntrophus gentianae]SEM53479.1 3-oxoacyl-[acyl-carrier protein] reductase [Syntrophus gentianae]
MQFGNKVVFITGGTKGLGRAMAEAFLAEGAAVAVNGRNPDATAKFAEEFKGQRILVYNNDITNFEEMEQTATEVVNSWGKVDILINNASIVNPLVPAEKIKKDDFDKVIDINLKGTFYATQAFGKKMITQKSGRIINIASQVALFGEKGFLPYAISKAGLIAMARGLSYEWSKYGVTICTLAPGFIKGGMNEGLIKKEAFVNFLSGKTPIGRMGTVDEVVGTVLFLASDMAHYINGETIVMDGGMTGYTQEGLLDFFSKPRT